MAKVRIMLVNGVEGMALYINETRVAGPKPWGGGTEVKSWVTDEENIIRALPKPPSPEAGE